MPRWPQRTVSERFMEHVAIKDGCWIWTASTGHNGYGQFRWGEKTMRAHRASWLLFVGHLNDLDEIDHRCRNIACVRPDHLRLTNRLQNMQNLGTRKDSTTGYRGVLRVSKGRSFYGQVQKDGSRYLTGLFSSAEEANEAVVALRRTLLTHNELDRT